MYISKLFLNKNKITNLKRKYGRNNEGKITVRYRKKGHKRLIRFVNDNLKLDKNFIVISIEYNPYKNKFLKLTNSKVFFSPLIIIFNPLYILVIQDELGQAKTPLSLFGTFTLNFLNTLNLTFLN